MRNKMQLLMVLKYLLDVTSENNPVSQSNIIDYLKSKGLNPGKNIVSIIMKAITDAGFDLITVKNGRYNSYYIPSDFFDMTEARLLADAVVSATFITQNKTEMLLTKVLRFTDREMEVHYMKDIVRENKQKHSNCSTYYTIDVIQEALIKGKQIKFCYFDLDEHKNRVYRHNHKVYEVCPITMINGMSKYYLIAYDSKEKSGKERTFRIDRMDSAAVSKKDVCKIPFDIDECISRYQSSIFSMYGGKRITAEFEFDFKAMNIIYDQYGENVEIMKIGENRYYAKLPIEDSPTFWGWMFIIGKHIKILSPQFLAEEYRDRLAAVLSENF